MATRITYRSVRLTVVRERCAEPYTTPAQIREGRHVADLARAVVGGDPREHMLAIYLDGRHRVMAVHVVSVGTAETATLHPREFFLPAVHMAASAVIAAHNHPSGDATPSAEDREVTDRLRKAGELLGIECLDHVIVGATRFYTFADSRFHPF